MLLSYGDNTYTYDNDGYLNQKTTPESISQYTYGTLGELKTVIINDGTNPSTVISYLHDANNQRVAKQVNGQITEKYLWGDLTTLLAVYDKDDNLIQRFEYAGQRMPVSMEMAGQTYYLHYNQVGSLRAVSDSNHTIVKTINYDSFGNIQSDSNPSLKIPFGFAGGLYDADTKLTRFGYRDYDAYTGRWTAKDPIDFAGGDTSLYGYVFSDPVNLVDPTGEFVGVLVGGVLVTVTLGVCYATHACDKFADAIKDAFNAWWSLPKPSDFMPSPPWVNNDSKSNNQNGKRPKDCPSDTKDIDKVKGKYGWSKDDLHGIKDGAHGGMGNGQSWTGVSPDGTVGINEGGEWSPQGHWEDLK